MKIQIKTPHPFKGLGFELQADAIADASAPPSPPASHFAGVC
jgi:hypothetical protein